MGRKSGSIKEGGGPLEVARLVKVRNDIPAKLGRDPVFAPRIGAFTSRIAKANQRKRVLQRKPLRPNLKKPPEKEATLEEKRLLRGGIDGTVASVMGAGWRLMLNDVFLRCFVSYHEAAIPKPITRKWWNLLESEINWTQPMVKSATGERQLPRCAAWLTKKGCKCVYKYGQTQWPAQPMEDWFLELTDKVCKACGLNERPNSCNANWYVDGTQQVGWHTDDEPLFDGTHRDTLIVSLSLGSQRSFQLSNNYTREVTTIGLKDGDICTMEGMLQKHYKHRVPSEPRVEGGRINLTWRWIIAHDVDCPAGNEQPAGSPSPVPGRQHTPKEALAATPEASSQRSLRQSNIRSLEDLQVPLLPSRKRRRFDSERLRVVRSDRDVPEPAVPAPVQIPNKEESQKRRQEVANFKTAIGSLGTVTSGRRAVSGNLPRDMRSARAKEMRTQRPRRKETLESTFEQRSRFRRAPGESRRAPEDSKRGRFADPRHDLDSAQRHEQERTGDLHLERGRDKQEHSNDRRLDFDNTRDQRREREQHDVDARHLRRRARDRLGHDQNKDRERADDVQHDRGARHGRGCERDRDLSRERRRTQKDLVDRDEFDIRRDRENDRGRREREDIQGLVNERSARSGQMQDGERDDLHERHRKLEQQRLRRRSERHPDCERGLESRRETEDSQSTRRPKPLIECDISLDRHRDRERRRQHQVELDDVVEKNGRHRRLRDRGDRNQLDDRHEREYDKSLEGLAIKERGHRVLSIEDAKDERDDRDRPDSRCELQEVKLQEVKITHARRLARRERPHHEDDRSPAFDIRSPAHDVRGPTCELSERSVLKERRSSHVDSKPGRPNRIDEPDLDSSARCRDSVRRVYRERSRSRSPSFRHQGYRGRHRRQDNSCDGWEFMGAVGSSQEHERREERNWKHGGDQYYQARTNRREERAGTNESAQDWQRDVTIQEDVSLVQSHRSRRRSQDEEQVQDKHLEKEDDVTKVSIGNARGTDSRPVTEKKPVEKRATSIEQGCASPTEEERRRKRAERFGLPQDATNRSAGQKDRAVLPTPPEPPKRPNKETEADRKQKRCERFKD